MVTCHGVVALNTVESTRRRTPESVGPDAETDSDEDEATRDEVVDERLRIELRGRAVLPLAAEEVDDDGALGKAERAAGRREDVQLRGRRVGERAQGGSGASAP